MERRARGWHKGRALAEQLRDGEAVRVVVHRRGRHGGGGGGKTPCQRPRLRLWKRPPRSLRAPRIVMTRATWLAHGLAPTQSRGRCCSCAHRGGCHRRRSAVSPPRASSSLDGTAFYPRDDSRLVQFSAPDFELVSRLGTVSYSQSTGTAQKLSWTVTEPDAAPDVLAVTDTAAVSRLAGAMADGANSAGGVTVSGPLGDERAPAVTLFAARCTTASVAPSRVLLKAYHAAQLGAAELAAYEALSRRCTDGAATFWLASDVPAWAEAPLAPVVGFFLAAVPPAPGEPQIDPTEVLWVVQRWVPLTSLATLASSVAAPPPPPAAPQSSWLDALVKLVNPFEAATVAGPQPPPQQQQAPLPPSRDRDAAIVRACVGAAAALAFLHSKRVAHGSLDAKCFLLDSGTVRLTNLGFATLGADSDGAQEQQALADAAQQDCRALGGAIAQAVFSSLSTEVRLPLRSQSPPFLSLASHRSISWLCRGQAHGRRLLRCCECLTPSSPAIGRPLLLTAPTTPPGPASWMS